MNLEKEKFVARIVADLDFIKSSEQNRIITEVLLICYNKGYLDGYERCENGR